MVFYKIFCSPITTKEERKLKDRDNILAGNIFANQKASLTYFGYKSILETLSLDPKKKHFKKLVAHYIEYNDAKAAD